MKGRLRYEAGDDLRLPLFEEDADLTGRRCAEAVHLMARRDWAGALDVAAGHLERVETAGHVGPKGRPGDEGQAYLHFPGPYQAQIYRRFFLPEGVQLHLVLDDYPTLYEVAGRCLRHLGRLDESIAAYRTSLAWCPMATSASLGLVATLREAKGHDDEVEQALKDALRRCLSIPDISAVYGELAVEATGKGETELARALVSLSLALDPNSIPAIDESIYLEYLLPRGTSALGIPDALQAVGMARLLLAPDQRFCALGMSLADAAQETGQYGRATYYLQCVYALAPSDTLARRIDEVSHKAASAGQRTDGLDGFEGSGTFVQPARLDPGVLRPVTPPDVAHDAAGRSDGKRGIGSVPPAVYDRLVATAHDHRGDGSPARGNGQEPNAMGGIPGVPFPGREGEGRGPRESGPKRGPSADGPRPR